MKSLSAHAFICAIVGAACVAASAGASPPSSNFDDSTLQGWSKLQPFNGNLLNPGSGGFPGGYLRVEDTMAGGGALNVIAPGAFAGDLSMYGGISWSEWLENCNPTYRTYPLLIGTEGTIFVPGDLDPDIIGAWHKQFMPFVAAQWTRASGSATFDFVLQHVAQIQFNMDVNTQCRFEAGIDNVALELSPVDPTFSSVGCLVICPRGDVPFEVEVRNRVGQAMAGVPVTVSFADCDSVVLCRPGGGESYQFAPGRFTIALDTDALGHVSFDIRGGGTSALPNAEVRANGVLLARRPVASPDLTGDLRVTTDDETELLNRLGTMDPAADLNCDGMVTGTDDSFLQAHLPGHDVPCDSASYMLDVAIVGPGTVDRSPDLSRYDHGTMVELTAIATPGWFFQGWSGDLAGHESPSPLRMDADKSVIATFDDHQLTDPSRCTIPTCMTMTGTTDGALVMPSPVSFTIRDVSGIPIPGATVNIDFSECQDLLPAAVQPYPGLTMDCGAKRISAVTDASGVATFAVVGGAPGYQTTNSDATCVQVRVDPGDVYLGDVHVSAWDLDGRNGFSGNDLNLWTCDYFGGLGQAQRSDYDCSGRPSPGDLNLWRNHWRQGTSSESGVRCDGLPASQVAMARDGTLRLAWNQCRGGGGAAVRTVGCDTNTGTLALYASMVAPSSPLLDRITSFDAVIDIIVPSGMALPEWWRFEPGACRSDALAVVTGSISSNCELFESSSTNLFRITYPYGTPNIERIEILGLRPSGGTTPTSGEEYVLFKMNLSMENTVDDGACVGCLDSVMVALQSVDLHQAPVCGAPAVDDSTIRLVRGTSTEGHVFAQGPITTDVAVGDKPGSLQVRLAGGNPRRGTVRLAFRAPASVPVTFDLIDVAGRRVERQILAGRDGNEQEVVFGATRALPPGVYLVRVKAGSSATHIKAVLIR